MDDTVNSIPLHDAIAVAALVYGVDPSEMIEIGGFESYVYEYIKDNQSFILKIIHRERRTKLMLLAEVEYINYLAEHGIPVSRCIPSIDGQYVYKVAQFYFVSYEKAKGEKVSEKDWVPSLFVQLGDIVGRMHQLAEVFTSSDPSFVRIQWHEEPRLQHFSKLLQGQPAVIKYGQGVLKQLHAYPVTSQNYGLIHYDCHRGNYFVVDGQITLFDFDDMQYNWYVNDIAVILYYVITGNQAGQNNQHIREFFSYFLAGYTRHRTLEREELERIPTFLKLRQFLLYIAISEKQAEGKLTERMKLTLDRIRGEIERNEEIIDINLLF
ncbi:phosphotransferase enzyme family protein [Paenibacillus arenosi]|uniref:Phosphotransferase n=1 Tax=Paenibacillus arenosi TaxID=2774142 RepID=A0ABR9ASA4_9BACL|nr:phosphotransferase [Paenibacillus arenosi]MBD8496989.1 phosphotransferase [Paenibacillus arenosi]